MDKSERQQLEALPIGRLERNGDWRDVEELAELGTAKAAEAVKMAREHSNKDVRNFALRLAKQSKQVSGGELENEVVRAVVGAAAMDGLDAALRFAEDCRTPRLRTALLDRARTGDDITRVNMAALLYYLIGEAKDPFDWDHRPYFLLFGDNEITVRKSAWSKLRAELEEFEEIQTR